MYPAFARVPARERQEAFDRFRAAWEAEVGRIRRMMEWQRSPLRETWAGVRFPYIEAREGRMACCPLGVLILVRGGSVSMVMARDVPGFIPEMGEEAAAEFIHDWDNSRVGTMEELAAAMGVEL